MSAPWLLDYVAAQRWYGAAGQRVVGAAFLARETISPGIDWALLHLHFQPGPNAVYQLFLDDASHTDVVERPEVVRWLFPDLPFVHTGDVALVAGEQSNTSLRCGGSSGGGEVIVKVFRRVPREANPDVAAVEGLWRVGYRSVPEPLGSVQRDGRDLAVARRYLAGAVDGWALALGDEGAFGGLVADLGTMTAGMHVALAEAFGSGPGDGPAWAEAMRRQLGRVELPGGADAGAEAVYRRLDRQSLDVGAAIRAHGDYHLGQVLYWQGAWYVIDFEGEPARPVAERVAPSSPLRDVAGMLRSFSYAAAVGGKSAAWERRVRQDFLHAYFSVASIRELIGASYEPVLAAFELDKAVYELGYERANRPEWASVPLAAITRLGNLPGVR